MPIQSGDVKLLKSAVMADVPEGGGAPTGQEIPDGVSNAIFPDISELDRAGGRVNLRKTFVQVQTDDTDTFFGSNVIVAEPPLDPRVSVTLFKTAQTFDTREQAQIRVEAYLNKGPEWSGYLYENHIAGQRAIQIFQRVTDPLPTVGQTLVLIENEGKTTQKEQYVRVISVNAVERTFTYNQNGSPVDYKANIVTCEISDALRQDFTGSPANRFFIRANDPNSSTINPDKTKLRDTVVADAGSYVGVVPLAQAASVGDFTIRTGGVYTQLVPSAQTETPVADAKPHGDGLTPIAASTAVVSFSTTAALSPTANLFVGQGILPGSLSVTIGATQLVDRAGRLMSGATQVGLVDYANGILTLLPNGPNYGSASKNISFIPATVPIKALQTAGWDVTQNSRSSTVAAFIIPVPAPGTLALHYRVQGRWYVLRDQGDGTLAGADASYGAGTLNFVTGSLIATLGALPDVGSAIIATWGTKSTETVRVGHTVKARQFLQLGNGGVAPGTVTISWTDGTTTVTATDNGNGQLQGGATGAISYATGRIEFCPNNLPPQNATLTVSYQWGPPLEQTYSHPIRNANGELDITLPHNNLVPGTVEVEWNLIVDINSVFNDRVYENVIQWIPAPRPVDPIEIRRDDGNGALVDIAGSLVDYSTGRVKWYPDLVIRLPRPRYATQQIGTRTVTSNAGTSVIGIFHQFLDGYDYKTAEATYPPDETGLVKIRYRTTVAGNTESETFTWTPSIDITDGYAETIVPGSVRLTFGGKTIVDRGGVGRLDTDIDYSNGSGTQVGSLSYSNGVAQLTSWIANAPNTGVVQAMLTTLGSVVSNELVFRTAVSPLRPGTFMLQFQFVGDSDPTIVSADLVGEFTHPWVQGKINYETGVCRVSFGRWVDLTPTVQAQSWYRPEMPVVDGKVFEPRLVLTGAVRYAVVAYSYLPLDASLLGIDPVRLPSDGRVPIFRPGGFAVVGHTGEIGPITVSNGQTINCGRVRLSRVRVIGSDGGVINTGYTADLEAGTVTFTNVSGYSQPVTIQHRIEDMGVVRDVQISGEITFTRPITHDYSVATPGNPRSGSYVSSALIGGDLFARVSLVFDQATWTGQWSDSRIGSDSTATFNNALHPITVTNRGAITERWLVRFTNSTAFEVIGENVGVIANGNTATDCAPLNPATGVPYFTIPALGWGGGWVAGNCLRFNTIAAGFPLWVVRTVQQGPETVTDDSFTLLVRGDVDTP